MVSYLASDVKVSSKFQVVIPREIRERMGLEKGDELTVDLEGETIVMRRKPKNFTKYTKGLHREVWADEDTERYLRGMRDEWGRKPRE